jgi:hypothetical protein
MRSPPAICIAVAAAIVTGAGVFVSPAQADWGNGYHRWHPHDGWTQPSGPPALIVAPRPTTYAPPQVVYVPPPAAYAPPPAYYAPGVAFGVTVR